MLEIYAKFLLITTNFPWHHILDHSVLSVISWMHMKMILPADYGALPVVRMRHPIGNAILLFGLYHGTMLDRTYTGISCIQVEHEK